MGQRVCAEHGAPSDVSTAVLIDERGVHTESTAVLRLLPSMGFPYNLLGPAALAVPSFIRDGAYRAFTRHRGAIWSQVKRATGLQDSTMIPYRDRIIGVDPDPAAASPLPPSWGFGDDDDARP
jgi:predicted DCC family thiol-disulfide oxidoreductase YuxK